MTKVGDYVRLNPHATGFGSYYDGCSGLTAVIVDKHPEYPERTLVRLSNGWARWCDEGVHLDPSTERKYLTEVAAFALTGELSR